MQIQALGPPDQMGCACRWHSSPVNSNVAHETMYSIGGNDAQVCRISVPEAVNVHGLSTCSSPGAAPLPLRSPASSARSASSMSLFRLACASQAEVVLMLCLSIAYYTIDRGSGIAHTLPTVICSIVPCYSDGSDQAAEPKAWISEVLVL